MYNQKSQQKQFPILQIPKNPRIQKQFNSPIFFIPPLSYNDEKFAPLSTILVPNQLPNRYIVSNYGYIWDCYMNQQCPVRSNASDKTKGYLRCHIAYYDTPFSITNKDIYVHRAVLMSFNYRPGCEALQVDHRDTDKWNNKLSNLQWTTNLENIERALNKNLIQNGLQGVIERNTLSESQVYDICIRRMQSQTISKIAQETGINISAVRNVVKRRTHCNISSQFDFPDIRNDKAIPNPIVHQICKDMQDQGSNVNNLYLSNKYNVSIPIIQNIRAGRSYKDIRNQYAGIIVGRSKQYE